MASGKKAALYGCLGCGGFLLLVILLLIAGVGFLSYQGYKFGKGVGESYNQTALEYNETNREFTFTPPENGVMDAQRVEALLDIRSHLVEFSNGKLEALEQTGVEIGETFDAPGLFNKIHGAKKIAHIVQQAAHLASDIGQEHIRLLRSQAMSAKEYQWIMKTYLGTLSQAANQNIQDASKMWSDYLVDLESSRQKMGDMNIDTGRHRIRGQDFNHHELEGRLKDVPFLQENYDIFQKTSQQLLPGENAAILDFLAIQLDEFIQESIKNAGGQGRE
ncbi:MAG: hypothetical protein JXR73_20675 [Candidatus Omnitrophica bacterium]|nr:hypothetical protein [Candidatus Omnitrophota bacterium]